MNLVSHTAFILAAGKGTRLRPYTDNTPKPMVRVWEKPILEHTIEKCKNDEIKNIIINLHYLGDIIESYFSTQKDIYFSKEKHLLDTGGGIKYARNHIKDDCFFLINGDAFWTDEEQNTVFKNLSNAWKPSEMDILLLLQPVSEMHLTTGIGDYDLDENGRAIRSLDKSGKYMFAGIRITKSLITDDIDEDVFSFLKCMDKAQEDKRLYGVIHKGAWHHISTPEDLDNINVAKPNHSS